MLLLHLPCRTKKKKTVVSQVSRDNLGQTEAPTGLIYRNGLFSKFWEMKTLSAHKKKKWGWKIYQKPFVSQRARSLRATLQTLGSRRPISQPLTNSMGGSDAGSKSERVVCPPGLVSAGFLDWELGPRSNFSAGQTQQQQPCATGTQSWPRIAPCHPSPGGLAATLSICTIWHSDRDAHKTHRRTEPARLESFILCRHQGHSPSLVVTSYSSKPVLEPGLLGSTWRYPVGRPGSSRRPLPMGSWSSWKAAV